MLSALESQLACHADDPGLVRGVRQGRQDLEAERCVERRHVDDDTAACLQMRPRGACQVEDQVDLAAASAVPFFVGDVFEPVEVGRCGEVEQHVDAAVRAQSQVYE